MKRAPEMSTIFRLRWLELSRDWDKANVCFETFKVVEAIKSRGTHFGFDSPRMSRAESTKKPTEFTYHPAPTEIKNKIDAHIYENSGLQSISDVKFNSDDD